jgi:hypothetical protein
MNDVTEALSLDTLVDAVSEQLLRAQARRIAAGRAAVFEVSELTLEVSFVVTTSKRGGGGIDLHVIKADGSVKYDRESIQKVTLTLTGVKDAAQPDDRFGPVRPRIPDDRP